jgi:hypothetical protein
MSEPTLESIHKMREAGFTAYWAGVKNASPEVVQTKLASYRKQLGNIYVKSAAFVDAVLGNNQSKK